MTRLRSCIVHPKIQMVQPKVCMVEPRSCMVKVKACRVKATVCMMKLRSSTCTSVQVVVPWLLAGAATTAALSSIAHQTVRRPTGRAAAFAVDTRPSILDGNILCDSVFRISLLKFLHRPGN